MPNQTKICQNCKKEFVIEQDERAVYEKADIPLSKECHRCRILRLMSFWLFGKFRKGKSDLSGKSIITIYPSSVKFPIYENSEWYSDAWTPAYQDYDFNRSFFEQLEELQKKIPRPHQIGAGNTNCEWRDDVWCSKNCYLARSFKDSENLLYSYRVIDSRDSSDLVFCFEMERCYDCVYCFKCFKVFYAIDSRNCLDSYFLYDCRNI